MTKPPITIDNALVIEWAWSGKSPFGFILYDTGEIASEIYGFAICRYLDSQRFYRFSCNKKWEVEQDSDYDSIVTAKNNIPPQYNVIDIVWKKYE